MAKKAKKRKNTKSKVQAWQINSTSSFYFLVPIVALLVALAFLYKSLNYGFTNFDDPQLLVNNQIVKDFDIKKMFTEFVYKDYLPLTFLTYAIEYSLVKFDPFWFHFNNTVLHLLNIVLVFCFVGMLTKKNYFLASFCCFLFAIFPTQPESIVWLSERKDVLSTFFLLLVYICYLFYRRQQGKAVSEWVIYVLSLIFLTLSLFAKAAGVTTAFILILIDYYNDRPWSKRLFIEKIPHLVVGLVFVYIHIVGHEVSGEQATTSFNPFYRLYLGAESLMFYISRSVFPFEMSPYYEVLSFEKPILLYLLGILVFCLLCFFAGEKKYNKKEILFGLGFFTFFIVPVLNIVPLRGSLIYADRYLYLSGIGLFLAYGSIIKVWFERWTGTIKRSLLVLGLISLTGYYLFMFNNRIKIWETSFTLWNDIVENNPRSITGHMQLAHAYLDAGNTKEAVNHAELGHNLNPENLSVNYSLGLMYFNNGQLDKSLERTDFVLKQNPQFAKALSVKALILNKKGQRAQAKSLMNQAIELTPQDITVLRHSQTLQ